MREFLLFTTFFVVFSANVYANSPNITAPSAIVIDAKTGEILYDYNSQIDWMPGSMTKIVAAFVTYEEIEKGNLSLDTMVRVSANGARVSTNAGGLQGSTVPFREGDSLSVEMLLRLMLLPSANAASVILGEHMFGSDQVLIDRMNAVMRENGLYANFVNSHGAAPHYTNAYSIAMITREFIVRYPDILRITGMRNVVYNGTTWANFNRLVGWGLYPGADGFKTGSLRESGWNQSSTAERDGKRVISVVMGTNMNGDRATESIRLLNFGFEELERREAERLNSLTVRLNGDLVELSSNPIIQNGALFLPISLLNSEVVHNHGNVQITAENFSANVHLGRTTAFLNGREISFDDVLFMQNEVIYAPLSFLAQVLNATTHWDKETGNVTITSRRSVPTFMLPLPIRVPN